MCNYHKLYYLDMLTACTCTIIGMNDVQSALWEIKDTRCDTYFNSISSPKNHQDVRCCLNKHNPPYFPLISGCSLVMRCLYVIFMSLLLLS